MKRLFHNSIWLNLIVGFITALTLETAICRQTTPTWKGYTTSAYAGNMGGSAMYVKGMNAKCQADFAGSHACTYRELVQLGNSYPFTYNAWVIDGTDVKWDGADLRWVTKDGANSDTAVLQHYPNCAGWSTSSSSYDGSVYSTSGYLYFMTCLNSFRIPCCQ